ncbi:hypothetical protein C8R47DRAFT_1318481 [Mycena vitilis]|nr:hypothetical protein C8R47DRAFT_1318481 [Mycena vitilis]
MGLSGRKEKQRIGHDPRNLTWADDAAKFGSSYLSKFGWDSSKGLGASGDGRLSHIKVSQKLDMLGIGAGQQKDANGIAWKQNKEFERLLERLNAAAEEGVKEEAADEGDEDEKKRKREDGDETSVKKKRRKPEPVAETVVAVKPVKTVVPHRRAHRARAIAAKNIANKSAADIAEILGIAPTPNSSAPATPQGTLTPYDDEVPLEKLTTSTKSVADYFKDKLLAKASKSGSSTPTPLEAIKTEIDYDAPRGGLGSSRVKLEPKDEDDPPVRMGLSKLSSMMAASFFSASTSATVAENVKVEEEDMQVDEKRDSSVKKQQTDKKGKRRQIETSESPEEEETGSSADKKKKKKRDKETEDKVPKAEPVDEDERRRAKQEKKRSKALKKEQADKEQDVSKEDQVDEEERKKAKQERKRLRALEKGKAVEE